MTEKANIGGCEPGQHDFMKAGETPENIIMVCVKCGENFKVSKED